MHSVTMLSNLKRFMRSLMCVLKFCIDPVLWIGRVKIFSDKITISQVLIFKG